MKLKLSLLAALLTLSLVQVKVAKADHGETGGGGGGIGGGPIIIEPPDGGGGGPVIIDVGSTVSFTLNCSSSRYRYAECDTGLRHVYHLQVQRQVSAARCEAGRSFGFNESRGTLWVDKGCRAEFFIVGAP